MSDVGCKQISFGIESGSQKIRNLIGKNFTDTQIRKALKACHRSDINVAGLFILGFPTETRREMKKSIALALRLQLKYCQFLPLVLYPSTDFFDLAVKNEMIGLDAWDRWATANGPLPIFVPRDMTRRALYEIIINSNKKFYLRLDYVLYVMKDIKSIRNFRKYLHYLNRIEKVYPFDF
jgi:radical SAM superfamily enzyme YgiQ (UPF0313 family)